MTTALPDKVFADIDAMLGATDELLAHGYPGDDGSRQPVHTVYVPADRFTRELPNQWGEQALAAAAEHGGMRRLSSLLGQSDAVADAVAVRVEKKLAEEPIEDLRLDFEDGYGNRGDETEDADATAAAASVAAAVSAGTAPPFIGIRFKCFEAATRARGLRTLDLFISGLVEAGELPNGLILTLPKVTTTAQVLAMEVAVKGLEAAHGLPDGRLRFEVQVETPQLIIGADGTSPVARLPHLTIGRISALHYGTYDYSASLEIAAAYQSMEHPAADFAKAVMQLAVAGTGIRLSDGSTNVLPIGAGTQDAWRLHGRLVRRSLERGFYQGWDMHPAQLPCGFRRRTPSIGKGTQQQRNGCATTSRAGRERLWTNRQLRVHSQASSAAACHAARSTRTRSNATRRCRSRACSDSRIHEPTQQTDRNRER
jgi:citrate lyase beta subunit